MQVPAVVLNHKDFPDRASHDRAIVETLKAHNVDLIVLAGYLRIFSACIFEAYPGRIINIHPALLPSFGGKNMHGLRVHQAVLDYGAKISGLTVHFVEEGVDTGPIILQQAVPVLEEDTAESLQARILQFEHEKFSEAIQLIAEGRVKLEGRRVRILEQPMDDIEDLTIAERKEWQEKLDDDREYLTSPERKKDRELWILKRWLESRVEIQECESPDFLVNGKPVEVTEVQFPERRRGDEIRKNQNMVRDGKYPLSPNTPNSSSEAKADWIIQGIQDKLDKKYSRDAIAKWILVIYADFEDACDTSWDIVIDSVKKMNPAYKRIDILFAWKFRELLPRDKTLADAQLYNVVTVWSKT
jgi:phosphoribosylglycinamide formyltransferase-1